MIQLRWRKPAGLAYPDETCSAESCGAVRLAGPAPLSSARRWRAQRPHAFVILAFLRCRHRRSIHRRNPASCLLAVV
jgi:hypothetical protein